jgi:hypothetical protein
MYLTNRVNGAGAFRCQSGGGDIPEQLKERCHFHRREKSQRILEERVWKIVMDDLDGMFSPEEAVAFAREAAIADQDDDTPRRRAFGSTREADPREARPRRIALPEW